VSTAAVRRIGAPDSRTRARLVDAAEQLLLEEGYAAVTSRRVGAKAELKPQLVHYYFASMDELFLEIFRRRAEENLTRFEAAVAADPSLHNLWQLNMDTRAAQFSVEFVALAKHRPELRSEIARYAERFRTAQLEALTSALAAAGVPADMLPPTIALLTMTGLAQTMALESSLGITAGHAETDAFIRASLDRIEPVGDTTAPKRRRLSRDR
jgi:AcrR family transcriptional regulator